MLVHSSHSEYACMWIVKNSVRMYVYMLETLLRNDLSYGDIGLHFVTTTATAHRSGFCVWRIRL